MPRFNRKPGSSKAVLNQGLTSKNSKRVIFFVRGQKLQTTIFSSTFVHFPPIVVTVHVKKLDAALGLEPVKETVQFHKLAFANFYTQA